MSPEARTHLRRDVMWAEGFRAKPYRDTVGKLTIGYGRNLDDVGITTFEAGMLLDHDLAAAESECVSAFAWYPTLADARQRVLVEMAFNLGLPRLLGFGKMLAAAKTGDYETAAKEMLASRWKEQVGARAIRMADQMRRGV